MSINTIDYDLSVFHLAVRLNIEKLFEHPGTHIAGGFAAKLAQFLLRDELYPQKTTSVGLVDRLAELNRYAYSSGDIDIFTTKIELLDSMKNGYLNCQVFDQGKNIKLLKLKSTQVLSFSPKEGDYDVNFQFIYSTEPGEENIFTFDLVNSMCWIDGEGLHYTDEWFEHRKSNTIHVKNWNKPLSTIKRIVKYMHNHGYTCLSRETEELMFEHAIKIISENNDLINIDKEKFNAYSNNNFLIKYLSNLSNQISVENLLLLSSLIPQQNEYDNNKVNEALKDRLKKT